MLHSLIWINSPNLDPFKKYVYFSRIIVFIKNESWLLLGERSPATHATLCAGASCAKVRSLNALNLLCCYLCFDPHGVIAVHLLAFTPVPCSSYVRCGSSKVREVSCGPAWSLTPCRGFAQSPKCLLWDGSVKLRLPLVLLLIKAWLFVLLFAAYPACSCWSCSMSLGLCLWRLAFLIHHVPSHTYNSFPPHSDSCFKKILTKFLSTGG